MARAPSAKKKAEQDLGELIPEVTKLVRRLNEVLGAVNSVQLLNNTKPRAAFEEPSTATPADLAKIFGV